MQKKSTNIDIQQIKVIQTLTNYIVYTNYMQYS
jgi:hypothetical protein